MKNILETLFPSPFASSSSERLSANYAQSVRRAEVREDVAYAANIVAAEHGLLKEAAEPSNPVAQVADINVFRADQEAQFKAQIRDQQTALAEITDALRKVKGAHGEPEELTDAEVQQAYEASAQKAQQMSAPPAELKSGQVVYLDKDEALQNAYRTHDEKAAA